eukprot:747293-Hanusia_phi.AAC.2
MTVREGGVCLTGRRGVGSGGGCIRTGAMCRGLVILAVAVMAGRGGGGVAATPPPPGGGGRSALWSMCSAGGHFDDKGFTERFRSSSLVDRALACFQTSAMTAGTLKLAGGVRAVMQDKTATCRCPKRILRMQAQGSKMGGKEGDGWKKLEAASLPMKPSSALTVEQVVHSLCEGLKYNDVPTVNSGLSRVFYFSDFYLRSSLTARCETSCTRSRRVELDEFCRKGIDDVEQFVRHCESPTFVALLRCDSWQQLPATIVRPGQEASGRGDLAVVVVKVAESGFERTPSRTGQGEDALRERGAEKEKEEEEEVEMFRLVLEKQRR